MSLAARAMQYSIRKDSRVLDTMAAAYAEKGDFEYAGSMEREALAAQGVESQSELAAQIRSRLALYAAHQPFREDDSAALGK